MDKRDVKGANIKRGAQTVVDGSMFCYDDGQTCRFCNCNVGIRVDSFQVGCETAAQFM